MPLGAHARNARLSIGIASPLLLAGACVDYLDVDAGRAGDAAAEIGVAFDATIEGAADASPFEEADQSEPPDALGASDSQDGPAANCPPSDAAVLRVAQVASVRDGGVLSRPASVVGRGGAPSALVGARVLWTFPDTGLKGPAADGRAFRTSTAALGPPAPLSAITQVTAPTDDAGAPYEFIPLTPQEASFGADASASHRIALWPTAVASLDAGALVAFLRLQVVPKPDGGGVDLTLLGVGLASVQPGSTTAVRDSGDLFDASEPEYDRGALIDSGFLYLYACVANPATPLDTPCYVSRARVASASDRSAYTFWDGCSWNADSHQASPVLRGPPGGLSVSWNAYLGSYIAVYNEYYSNAVKLQQAPRPEGPWSAPVDLFTAPTADSSPPNPGPLEHAELSPNRGQTLIVTYVNHLIGYSDELRIVAVDLQ
jgi:hypothetical protein